MGAGRDQGEGKGMHPPECMASQRLNKNMVSFWLVKVVWKAPAAPLNSKSNLSRPSLQCSFTPCCRKLPSRHFASNCFLSGDRWKCFTQGKEIVLVLSCLCLPFPSLHNWLERLRCLMLLSSFSWCRHKPLAKVGGGGMGELFTKTQQNQSSSGQQHPPEHKAA